VFRQRSDPIHLVDNICFLKNVLQHQILYTNKSAFFIHRNITLFRFQDVSITKLWTTAYVLSFLLLLDNINKYRMNNINNRTPIRKYASRQGPCRYDGYLIDTKYFAYSNTRITQYSKMNFITFLWWYLVSNFTSSTLPSDCITNIILKHQATIFKEPCIFYRLFNDAFNIRTMYCACSYNFTSFNIKRQITDFDFTKHNFPIFIYCNFPSESASDTWKLSPNKHYEYLEVIEDMVKAVAMPSEGQNTILH
jgi:hypothetical protein